MATDTTVETTKGEKALRPRKRPIKSFFDFFGGKTLRLNNDLGALAIFFFRSFFMIFRIKAIPDIVQQIYFIGAKSSQIVMLVGFFTGMVLGLQLYFVLVKFGSVGVLGTAIALTLIREMGPVLAAIMITARAGSAMTAEIGIQRISEQVDALTTMRIDPLGYLISPRIAAAIISFPILTAFFDLIGIIGAWVSGCLLLGVNSGTYFSRVISSTQIDDITDGFTKSIVFGLLVVTVCCFQGYFTHMRTDSFGAKSVSLSTTSAVVISCVMILISDYIVTSLIV
ncbi:MAG: ABC transporter permease [Desulfobacteraceae bacterium]|jgi:phospholipid/cholesterol/gamma-HCH transport system permease protein|nr:ABC transporter permease [Desulfobacteraceae bacterium]